MFDSLDVFRGLMVRAGRSYARMLGLATLVVFIGFAFCAKSVAADWPQWRYDAYRSASSPEELPKQLRLEWVREYSPRVQAWDDPLNNDLMTFDRIFEPIVLGNRMIVGFNDRDKIVALDTATGREAWAFYTDGPVRLAPAGWDGKIYFVCDDGFLYCVKAENGTLVWKHRGGPSDRMVLGNTRLTSAWPARGGPVIRDGKVYFAASIWPFMGTFVYALDASTGGVIWVNDGTGSQYIKQPHAAPAFAGVAPQGSLVATRDTLLVPGGRSVPAAFDLQTGRFRYFQLEEGGKGNGGSFVAANDTNFFVHTRLRGTRAFDLKSGKKSSSFTINEPVLTGSIHFSGQPSSSLKAAVLDAESKLAAARQTLKDAQAELAKAEEEGSSSAYKKATNSLASALRKIGPAERALASAFNNLSNSWSGPVVQSVGADRKIMWEVPVDGTGDIIRAGNRLYAAGTNSIVALELSAGTNAPRVAWSNQVNGQVQRLLAANGKLFAVTLDGRIMAFGQGNGNSPARLVEQQTLPGASPEMRANAKKLIARTDAREGYALWLGVDDGRLLEAVLAESQLEIVAVEPDAEKVNRLRKHFDAMGWNGPRVTLHAADPATFHAPKYFANAVVIGDQLAAQLVNAEALKNIYDSVRPYGGTIWVAGKVSAAEIRRETQRAQLANAKVQVWGNGITIVKQGALPGSADWTHQYGDIANTVKSDDRLVKLPLGVLWFGGNSHMDVLPRHGHGPSEQVAGGRLFIQGMNSISARDVYTGRVLWKTEFADLGGEGVYYDHTYTNTPLSTAYNQKHIPGANARGANYVVSPEAVYVVVSNTCHVLDSRSGRLVRVIELPKRPGEEVAPEWGYIGLHGDLLLAGSGFAYYTTRFGLATNNVRKNVIDLSASRGLVVLNRHTGKVLWRAEAHHGFIHNGIVAGNGRVYCLDKLPKSVEDKLKRRGRNAPADYRVAAYDLRTGKALWEANTNVFGTWLSYSKQHDVLLLAGASATDRLKDEAVQGMATYQGQNGKLLWQKMDLKYTGPCVIHNDLIITTPTAYKASVGGLGLVDGESRTITNPLTGQPEPLKIYRTYGCNYPVACEYLLTFRSGAAGYYDLETHSGTGNFGGFKSGCSANLIAANGILNAPDYTRTCSCAYQNQTSLGLVHMPELEIWTHNQYGSDAKAGQRIRQVGVNFGAPGDRIATDGTLWVDHPSVGGSSPNVTITVSGTGTNFYRRHSSQFSGTGPAWVMGSGVLNAEQITIRPEMRRPIPPPASSTPPKKADDDDDDDDDDEKETAASTSSSRRGSRSALTNRAEAVITNTPMPAATYTVRLYFAEPEILAPGDRVFAVSLQGQMVAASLDIAAAAGGTRKGIVKEFKNVRVTNELVIGLKRSPGTSHGPVISGVQMILEKELEMAARE